MLDVMAVVRHKNVVTEYWQPHAALKVSVLCTDTWGSLVLVVWGLSVYETTSTPYLYYFVRPDCRMGYIHGWPQGPTRAQQKFGGGPWIAYDSSCQR